MTYRPCGASNKWSGVGDDSSRLHRHGEATCDISIRAGGAARPSALDNRALPITREQGSDIDGIGRHRLRTLRHPAPKCRSAADGAMSTVPVVTEPTIARALCALDAIRRRHYRATRVDSAPARPRCAPTCERSFVEANMPASPDRWRRVLVETRDDNPSLSTIIIASCSAPIATSLASRKTDDGGGED